jgi:hypothetical protein
VFAKADNPGYTSIMGEKHWLQDFETGLDRLRVYFVTEHGRVVLVVVIQYEAFIDGEWRAIVRYDEAHGYYHKDVMSPFAGQTKVAQSAADMNSALADAIADIRKNWPEYRRMYEVAYYGKKQSH